MGEAGIRPLSRLPALGPAGRIVDSVHAALRTAILDGVLAPGQALSVPELSRQLAVSRSPVREAVLALVGDGLAIELPRRGAAVAAVETADLLEIHEIREGVEAQAARLCAERAGDEVLRRLSAVLEQQRSIAGQNDPRGWFDTNAAFHALIAEGAVNRRLAEIVLSLQGQMRLGLRQVSTEREQHSRGLAEHLGVLDAITRREPETAERLMREHIRRTRETLARRLG
jgi:DNA-binding GntR family transcriptional regulator